MWLPLGMNKVRLAGWQFSEPAGVQRHRSRGAWLPRICTSQPMVARLPAAPWGSGCGAPGLLRGQVSRMAQLPSLGHACKGQARTSGPKTRRDGDSGEAVREGGRDRGHDPSWCQPQPDPGGAGGVGGWP